MASNGWVDKYKKPRTPGWVNTQDCLSLRLIIFVTEIPYSCSNSAGTQYVVGNPRTVPYVAFKGSMQGQHEEASNNKYNPQPVPSVTMRHSEEEQNWKNAEN